MPFALDPKLENDSYFVCDLPLCQVRLSKNAAFPWLLLIPKRPNIIEIIDLTETDQIQLLKEIRQASKVLQKLFQPKKLNIANLGNIVSQCHIHVIARYEEDKAWPHPIWNRGINETYEDEEQQMILSTLIAAFKG